MSSNLGRLLGQPKEFDIDGTKLLIGQPRLRDLAELEDWERENPDAGNARKMAQLVFIAAKKYNSGITIDHVLDEIPIEILNDIVGYITGEEKTSSAQNPPGPEAATRPNDAI
jgi:hypothetical protein